MSDFKAFGLRSELNQALHAQRITDPTPVQDMTIPAVLAGSDVIVQAQTGTGKTFAFLLPILTKVDAANPALQALIVTPTRELAIQITHEAEKLTAHLNDINVLAVHGGRDVAGQVRKLNRGIQIAIGTPGRILDHMRRGTIRLSGLSMLVLDEADQMLHLGFLPEIEQIIKATPQSRQTMLFSATMPAQVRSLAKRYLRHPKDIRIRSKSVTVEAVQQVAVETTDRTKQDTLKRLIDESRPYLAIIFCRTKRRAKTLAEALQGHGYLVDELHGDLSQRMREQVIRKFRNAEIQLLVATDVAARGLDVEGVTHVFNYDIPHDVESYIHRIGRTARAGDEGMAITLVAPKDKGFLQMIEKGLQQSIEKQVNNAVRSGLPQSGRTPSDRTARDPKKKPAARGRTDRRERQGRTDGGERQGRTDGRERPSRRQEQTQTGRRGAGRSRSQSQSESRSPSRSQSRSQPRGRRSR